MITVGIKILVGGTVASNIFIGSLLYVNLKSNVTVEEKVNEVIEIREKLSSNLRAAIVDLQNEFLMLPEFFKIDPNREIIAAIEKGYTISTRDTLEGRGVYKSLYNRKERRDLSKNKVVLQQQENSIYVSWGIIDGDRNFTDTVIRLSIATADPAKDLELLRSTVETIVAEAGSALALQKKVLALNAMVADAGLEAEASRNEILDHVENINVMEQELVALRAHQKKFSLWAAGFGILANMVFLFVLVRWLVEKPLHRLTWTINDIRSGKNPDIPFTGRKDQIGILSGAITNFREALSEIKSENERKEHEKVIIDEMFTTITSVVNTLENRARELVGTANSLEELAFATEHQTESVTLRASETAEHTNNVSVSTARVRSAFDGINDQMHSQNEIVNNILKQNQKSHEYIDGLDSAVRDIQEIITMVTEITGQTKLLALNATIEAARAGAAGKGFGVVAGEVKELSYRTEQATKGVMSRVQAIEEASSVLVGNLKEIDERVEALSQMTSTITTAVHEQQDETAIITSLASQTSDNTQDVSLSINEVSLAATQTRDLAAQVHSFSSEIAEQLTSLLQDTTSRIEQLSRIDNSTQLSTGKENHGVAGGSAGYQGQASIYDPGLIIQPSTP